MEGVTVGQWTIVVQVGSRLQGYRGSIVAQSPYLEYIPWISYPVPRSHHTIPIDPYPGTLPSNTLYPQPSYPEYSLCMEIPLLRDPIVYQLWMGTLGNRDSIVLAIGYSMGMDPIGKEVQVVPLGINPQSIGTNGNHSILRTYTY